LLTLPLIVKRAYPRLVLSTAFHLGICQLGARLEHTSVAWYFMMRQRLPNRLYQEKREAYLELLDALRAGSWLVLVAALGIDADG
jgi:hypothetical protein